MLSLFTTIFIILCCIQYYTGAGQNDPKSKKDKWDNIVGRGYLMLNSLYTFPCCGVITAWEFHVRNAGELQLQVWRATSTAFEYQLVGEALRIVSDNEYDKEVYHALQDFEKQTVIPNDKMGWQTVGLDIVPFKEGGGEVDNNHIEESMPDISVGQTFVYTSARTIDRSYGIRAYLGPGEVSITDSMDPGDYQVWVRVTDTCGLYDQAYLTVSVLNSKPKIVSLPASIDIYEYVAVETTLHFINVTDDDSESEVIVCSISDVSPSTLAFDVKMVPNTIEYAVILKAGQILSYDTVSAYTLKINCSDDVDYDIDRFMVYLQKNNPPIFTNLPDSVVISAKSTSIGSHIFSVFSVDSNNDQVVYTMTCLPSPCPLSISTLGSVEATRSLEAETVTSYSMNVYADDGRNVVGPAVLDIILSDLNTAPVLADLPLTVYLSELTPPGSVVYIFSASDPDAGDTVDVDITSSPTDVGPKYFEFDNSIPALKVRNSALLNYETMTDTNFSFTVIASDVIFLSNSEVLTVLVVDDNEAPSFQAPTYYITTQEATKGTSLPDVGFSIQDEDQGDIITFHISGGLHADKFAIDNGSGQLTFASDLDISDIGTDTITINITATDTGGLLDETELVILIENVNKQPVLLNVPQTISVSEATVSGAVLFIVTVLDDETLENLDFFLTFDPSGSVSTFLFNETTKELSLSMGQMLNYESDAVYKITFRVSDGELLSDPASLVINILDVNESPMFMASLYHITAAAGKKGITLGNAGFQIEDDDVADVMSFRIIGGSEAHMFTMDISTGELFFAADYKVSPENSPTTATIAIEVSDQAGLTDSTMLEIQIVNINQRPTFLSLPHRFSVPEDTPTKTVLFTVHVRDDNSQASLTFHHSVEPSTCATIYSFNITSGEISISPGYQLDHETNLVCNITFQVDDGEIFSESASLVIDITDVNESPVFSASTYYITTAEGKKGVALPDPGFNIMDEDANEIFTFHIMGGADANKFSVDRTSGMLTFAKDFDIKDVDNPYTSALEIAVSDQGGLTDTTIVQIQIENVNQKPALLNLPQRLSLIEGTPAKSVLYIINVASDSLLETFTFHLVAVPSTGAAVFDFNQSTRELSLGFGSHFDYESTSVYNITFQVDDGELFSDAASLIIDIIDVNENPVFSAPVYYIMTEEGKKGIILPDPQFGITDEDIEDSFTFRISGGMDADQFSIDGLTGMLSFATDVDVQAPYSPVTFDTEVEVADEGGLTGKTLVKILIQDVNQKPALLNLPHRLSVTEATPAETVLYTVNVRDDSLQTSLTFYHWGTPSTGAAMYSFNDTTGELSISPGHKLDHEVISVYNITFEIDDGEFFSDAASLVIDITDVNESPVFSASTYYITTAEGKKGVVLPDPHFSVYDEDAGDTYSFRILGGSDAGKFSVNTENGVLSYAKDFYIEAVNSPTTVTIEIGVSDNGGLTATTMLLIDIENVNQKPTLLSLPKRLSVIEGTPSGTLLCTLIAEDDGLHDTLTFHVDVEPSTSTATFVFSQISRELSIAFGSKLDFERVPSYNITFQVDDGELFSDPAGLMIDVTDINESPSFSASVYYITTTEGKKGQVLPDPEFIVMDADVDEAFMFRILVGPNSDRFSINSTSGIVMFASNIDIQAADSASTVTIAIEVSDRAGLTDNATIEIRIEDVNQRPALVNLPQTLAVIEGMADGMVLYRINVDDDSLPESLIFHFSAEPNIGASTFRFNQSSHELSLIPGYSLDYERVSVYNITFQVNDGELFSKAATLTIKVLDVNERPVFPTSVYFMTVTEAKVGVSLPDPLFFVVDEDVGDTLSYMILPDPATDKFQINQSTGLLSFASDFDVPRGGDTVAISVEVKDSGGLTDSADVIINIENMNHAPVFSNLPQHIQLSEDTPPGTTFYHVIVEDDDADVILNFLLKFSPHSATSLFHFNQSTGGLSMKTDMQLNYENEQLYNLTLQVDDGELTSDLASLVVEVLDVNEPPIFSLPLYHITTNEGKAGDALPDANLFVTDEDEGDTVRFHISDGMDAHNFLINVTTGQLLIASDFDILSSESPKVTILQVEGRDSAGLTTLCKVKINIVNVNKKPYFMNLPQRISLSEDLDPGTTFYRAQVRDDDIESLIVLLDYEPSSAASQIKYDVSTGTVLLSPNAHLDFETQNFINVTFHCHDGELTSDPVSLVIDVLDVNESPFFSSAFYHLTTTEGKRGTPLPDPEFVVFDDDTADTTTFHIIGGDQADKFSISQSAGLLYYADDYDVGLVGLPTSVSLTIKVVDSGGLSGFTDLQLTIDDVNQTPVFLNLPKSIQIPENLPVGSSIYRVNVNDPDLRDSRNFHVAFEPNIGATVFDFNSSSGDLTLLHSETLDYETVSTYILTFEVDDGELSTGEASLELSVLDINEQPVFMSSTYYITTPSTSAGSVLPDPSITFWDPDFDDTQTFSIKDGTDSGIFTINQTTGVLTLSTDFHPSGTSEILVLDIQITDTYGAWDTAKINIKILHVNTAPNITNLPADIKVPETSTPGTWLYHLTVWDPDLRDLMSFHLVYMPAFGASIFAFNETTRELTLSDEVGLNFEVHPQYKVTVIVNDGTENSEPGQLVIDITDVPEPPRFALQTYYIHTKEGQVGMVLPDPGFTIKDDDTGDLHTLSLIGGEYAAFFSIDPVMGILSYFSDYDLDNSVLPNHVSLVINVQDSAGLTATATLDIVIEDVNDNPPIFDSTNYVITLDPSDPVGINVLDVNATDADSLQNAAVTYKLDQTALLHDMFAVSSNGKIYLSTRHESEPGSILNFTVVAYNQQDLSQATSALVQVIVQEKPLATTVTPEDLKQESFFQEPENVGLFVAGLLALAVALIAVSCLLAKCCRRNKTEQNHIIIRSLKELTESSKFNRNNSHRNSWIRNDQDGKEQTDRQVSALSATAAPMTRLPDPSTDWRTQLPYTSEISNRLSSRPESRLTLTSHYASYTDLPATPTDVEISSCERDFRRSGWTPWSMDERF